MSALAVIVSSCASATHIEPDNKQTEKEKPVVDHPPVKEETDKGPATNQDQKPALEEPKKPEPQPEPKPDVTPEKEEPKVVVFPSQESLTFDATNKDVFPSSISNVNFNSYIDVHFDSQSYEMIEISVSNQNDANGSWTLSFKLQDISSKEISSQIYKLEVSGFKTVQMQLDSIDLDFNAADKTTRPNNVNSANFNTKVTITNKPDDIKFILVEDSLKPEQQNGILSFQYNLSKNGFTSKVKTGSVRNFLAFRPFNPKGTFTAESIKKLITDKEYATEVNISDLQKTLEFSENTLPKPEVDEAVSSVEFLDMDFVKNNKTSTISFKYKLKNSLGQETDLKTFKIPNFKNDTQLSQLLTNVTITPTITPKGVQTFVKNSTTISGNIYQQYFNLSFSDPRVGVYRNTVLSVSPRSNYSETGSVSILLNVLLKSDSTNQNPIIIRRTITLSGFNKIDPNKPKTITFANTIAENNISPSQNMYSYFQLGQSPQSQGHITTNVDLKNNGPDKTAFDFMANRVVALHVNYDSNKEIKNKSNKPSETEFASSSSSSTETAPNIQSVGGTGWLIGKASATDDPYNPDFYSYYVATNLHVYTAFLQRQVTGSLIDYSWTAFKQYNQPQNFMLQKNLDGQWDDTQIGTTRSDYAKGDIDYIYSATDLTAKVDHWTKDAQGKVTNTSTITSTINHEKGNLKLAVDFAVMKVNFLSADLKASLAKAKQNNISIESWSNNIISNAQTTSGHNEDKIRIWNAAFIQHLTKNTLANFPDLQFAQTSYNPVDGADHTSADLNHLGYTAGYPATSFNYNGSPKSQFYIGDNNSQIGSGYMFTRINKIDEMIQHNSLTSTVVNTRKRTDTSGTLDYYPNGTKSMKTDQSIVEAHIGVTKSVQYLNVGGGSSGSPFFEANNPSLVLGIYRGVYFDGPNEDRSNVFGQIVQLRVKGYYDVIGGATPMDDTTPANHTLYSTLMKLHQEHPDQYRVLNLK